MTLSKKAFEIVITSKLIILIIFFASIAYAELKLDSVYPTLGAFGQNLEVTLRGAGFDENTKVSMYLDTTNQRMIIGSVDTPGEANDVTVVGDKAYVADDDSGLHIIDISNPANPQIIGSVDTPGDAYDVTVVGTTAYVADSYNGGLQVIDISNPANPKIIGSVDTPGSADSVAVAGDRAYVADWFNGLQVIDISNPTSPQIIGSVDTPGIADSVAVAGDRAYVAEWFPGLSKLQVIDISNPTNPQIIGSVDTTGSAHGVTVIDDRAYVADGGSGLQIIDISNPTSPQIIGSVDTPGSAYDITVAGDRAYVADGGSGLQIIDISNPASPQIIGSVNTPSIDKAGSRFGVAVAGDRAYVADSGSGLQVIDVSTPTSPQIIGAVDTPSSANGVTVVDNTAYVADWSSGLQVIDISNPASPQIIGSVDTPGIAYDIAVADDRAYVADGGSGLQIIDISNPAGPQIIGSVDTPDTARGVAVAGDRAYVAGWYSGGLAIIDISNPASPQIIGSVETPGWANSVAVAGDEAYVADWYGGLKVIDISNPASPQIIGTVSTPGTDRDVTIAGGWAYVVNDYIGLKIIDISNPASPQIIGSVDTPGNAANSIAVAGDRAYVANLQDVQVIDITDPTKPRIIGSVDTPGRAVGVSVTSDKAYVADSGYGLVVVALPVEIEPVTVNSATSISVTLPSPIMAGHYTLRVFNETGSDELIGAVSFTTELQILNSKAIIVAGGGPNAPGDIWEETKQSANKAYDVLVHEGYVHDSIWYLTGEAGNPFRDGSALRHELDWAINSWASDASELVIFFVDHGLPDKFIIYDDGQFSQHLSVTELDNWLDNLQQNMPGPITLIYDACHSGTFASKLVPPAGKDRIIITGASDEPAYFRGEDSFSFQFWDQIFLDNGNLGSAFSEAADIMRGYQTALINANGNSLTNEAEDITKANDIVIRRGQPIYVKPAPIIDNVVSGQTLNVSASAAIWVSNVREAESVLAKIIPPDINPDVDGVPITDLDSIQLQDTDHDGVYDGQYNDFTTEGTYTIIINAQTSQEIYSYVQGAMVTQTIPSSPVYTSVTQMNGVVNISADDFEEDDTYPQANVITLNDLDVQPHSFHDLGDIDWVKFYGLSGQTYTIKAGNVSVICDVVIELFDSDGITRLVGPLNGAGDGKDEVLEWTCTRDDVYFVKIGNVNATFGENCKYDLKLYRAIGPIAGFLIGSIEDQSTKQTLADVQIKTDLNQTTLSLSNGSYLMVHPPGTFKITAQKAGYDSKDIFGVAINEGGSTALDITLMRADTDVDGIPDVVETASVCLDPNDADTDDDCIPDGVEDANHNGFIDGNETDPCDRDTDGDGIQDGTELGYTSNDANPDTNPSIFKPDLDPFTTTDPLDNDSDKDGLLDGQEDANYNGRVDSGETNPTISDLAGLNAMPWIPLLLLNE